MNETKTLHSRKAFTLIELLVVVSIIGVLTSVGMYFMRNLRPKARDTRRTIDISRAVQAFSFYLSDNPGALGPEGFTTSGFACTHSIWKGSSNGANGFAWNTPTMIEAYKNYGGLPMDPITNTSANLRYDAFYDADGSFCCMNVTTCVIDQNCTARHAKWMYITYKREIAGTGPGKKNPQCVAGSQVNSLYTNWVTTYLDYAEPPDIFQ